jgi:glyoxylase-like metal-dependent hydrolase (beta-lactamase superfamily II)
VVAAWDERAVLFNRGLLRFLRQAGVPPAGRPGLIEVFGFAEGRVRSVPVDFLLDENEPPEGLRVIHTPGHSPGHVCILVGDVLLCGDHILARTIPQQWPESIAGYTGLGHYLDSLEKIRRIEGISVAMGGHEPPISSIRHRIEEIFAAHERRLHRLLDIAARSSPTASMADLTRRMYSRQRGFYELLALMDVGSRVEYLEQRGRLEIANLDDVRREPHASFRYRPAKSPAERASEVNAPRGNTA